MGAEMPITLTRKQMTQKLNRVFSNSQTEVLADVLDDIRQAELQRAEDTQELKRGLITLTTQVNKLTEAQQRVDERLAQLAEAQQRTDERLAVFEERANKRFAQLAEGQNRLAKAQQRTDERLAAFEERANKRFAQLAEAQQRTDERLAVFEERANKRFAQLAEAQQRTDERLAQLVEVVEKGFKRLHQEVSGLSNRFGFDLEEFVAALLPPYLERHQGITNLVLQRGYFQLADKRPKDLDEVDLAGSGKRAGEAVTVLAECRTSIKGGEARKLVKKLKKVRASLGERKTLLVIVAMNIHPSAQTAGEKGGVLMVPYSRINRPGDFERE